MVTGALTHVRATDIFLWGRILSGDGRGLQNRKRVRESVLGWVRPPHASATLSFWILDFGFWIPEIRQLPT